MGKYQDYLKQLEDSREEFDKLNKTLKEKEISPPPDDQKLDDDEPLDLGEFSPQKNEEE
jgi:hypothetical protein